MGRAGRGGGGGGSRGSGFGGSRGFGSHSGSSSSHRSGFSGSSHRSGSSWGGYNRPPSHHYSTGPSFFYINTGSNRYYRPNSYNGYSGGARDTDIKKLIKIFIIIFIAIIVISMIGSSSGSGITRSTVEREKLESSSLVENNDYYIDTLGWINSSSELESGMKYFYKKTGVQPFLIITDTVDGTSISFSDDTFEDFANDEYDELFEDEAHLLVVFFERNGEYRSCYVVGTEAKTVIDEEAGEILLDYIDHYYYSDYSEEDFFSLSFEKSADRIMKVTPNYAVIVTVLIVIAVIIYILYKWWKKNKQHKLDEMSEAEKILNSNLNEFGTSGGAGYTATYDTNYSASSGTSNIDELKKKYDN